VKEEIIGRSCTVCGEWKLFSDFNKNRGRKYGCSNVCKVCKKKIDKHYYEKNKEKIIRQTSEYHKKNPEVKKKCCDNYRAKNKDKIRESDKLYRKHHFNERYKYNKLYFLKNPDKIKIYAQRYRNRLLNASGNYTRQEWIDLCSKCGNRCICCGLEVKLTVDHIIPLSRGGSNCIDNIQPLCKNCNSSKNNKIIDYRKKFTKDAQ